MESLTVWWCPLPQYSCQLQAKSLLNRKRKKEQNCTSVKKAPEEEPPPIDHEDNICIKVKHYIIIIVDILYILNMLLCHYVTHMHMGLKDTSDIKAKQTLQNYQHFEDYYMCYLHAQSGF